MTNRAIIRLRALSEVEWSGVNLFAKNTLFKPALLNFWLHALSLTKLERSSSLTALCIYSSVSSFEFFLRYIFLCRILFGFSLLGFGPMLCRTGIPIGSTQRVFSGWLMLFFSSQFADRRLGSTPCSPPLSKKFWNWIRIWHWWLVHFQDHGIYSSGFQRRGCSSHGANRPLPEKPFKAEDVVLIVKDKDALALWKKYLIPDSIVIRVLRVDERPCGFFESKVCLCECAFAGALRLLFAKMVSLVLHHIELALLLNWCQTNGDY